MSASQSIRPRRLSPASIGLWLQKGWQDFTEASFISIAYAAIFCVFGAVALIWLLKAGMGVFFFYLAGGFMLVAPVLVTGYYRVARMLNDGGAPVFDDIVRSYLENPRAILSIGLLVAVVFVIWVLDALLVYNVFFGDTPVFMPELASEPGVRGNSMAFVLIGSAMGSVLAFLIYTVTVFSIPDAFHRHSGFRAAIVTSVKGVFANLDVMLLWAAVLAVLTFGTLLVALPLIIVLFPVMGYASYAAYMDLIGELPESAGTN